MREILTYLFEQNTLTHDEAKDILVKIGQGTYSDPEIASFLTVYLMRKITPQELAGFRDALLELCVPVDLSDYNTIDVCGTGGDEKNTFNVSTLTSFVIAGAGVKVVKHGNYGVSSPCGSSNILEHFGYKFSNDQDKIRKEIEEAGICYLHAPFFHPAMKHVGPVRKSLRLKTFFNLLGPMVNPSRPNNQIVGVFNEEVLELYNQVYKDLGINYYILYSLDGYDEISLTGDFRAVSKDSDQVFSPESIGLSKTNPEELFGGDTVEEAAKIFKNILEGNGTTAQVDAVIANAAFGLQAYNPKESIENCVAQARESLESGNALKVLEKLVGMQ